MEVTGDTPCAQCGTGLGADRVVLSDRSLCGSCYAALAAELARVVAATSADVNYPMAAVGAVLGGVVGVVAWWAFTVLTRISFGLVAVVIGYLVGTGTVRFAGNKRAVGLQVLAAVVAAVSFVGASYLVNMTLINGALAHRSDPFRLPIVPDSLAQLIEVVSIGFSAMDVAFLGITVWQAWGNAAADAARGSRSVTPPDDPQARTADNLRAVWAHLQTRAPEAAPNAASDAPAKHRFGQLGAVGVTLALLLGKLKFLAPLANVLQLKTLATMVLSIGFYAAEWGWSFAVGFVALLFVHELGHALVLRREGIAAGAPVFIPFVGAVIAMEGRPRDAYVEAKVGIGGPLLGSLGAWAVLATGVVAQWPLFVGLGHVGIMLNLFNLVPVSPLDGGRVAGAFTRPFWVAGYALGLVVMLLIRSPILMLMMGVGLFTLVDRWRNPVPGYDAIGRAQRLGMAGLYLGLVVALVVSLPIGQGVVREVVAR